MRREGRPRSRFAPFGWRTADGSVEARRGDRRPLARHPAEQRLLRLIEDLRAVGLGARRVARRLDGVGPNPRTGRPWTHRAVERILATADRRSTATT